MFMRVSLVELLCQTVMGQIPALEYMVSGARGLLRPRPIVPSLKCCRFLKALVMIMHIRCRKPPSVLTECLGLAPGSRRQVGRADRWQNPACPRLS
jgi:hypothetical protein